MGFFMRSIATVSGLALLCASAAVAEAGDLPAKKAAPAEADSLRECTIGKFKGLLIPGSETCLKLGGRIRSETFYNERFARADNVTRFRVRGYISADTMTPTEYGGLSTRSRFYVQQTTGGTLPSTTGTVNADGAFVDYAFIQFAGFTFGRYLNSFYDFAQIPGNTVSYVQGGSNGRGSDLQGLTGPISAAYTYSLDDLSATIALEDPTARLAGITVSGAGVATNPNAGARVPDIIGRLEYTQGWGTLAVTGALHRVAYNATTDSEWGYAGQVGAKINLPMVEKGDYIVATAAYAEGASSFTGLATNAFQNESVRAGSVSITSADAVLNGTRLEKSKTWSLYAGAVHLWTPTVSQSVFGAVGNVDQFGTANDGRVYTVGSQLAWKPVKGLEIGVEAVYARIGDLGAAKVKSLKPDDSKEDWTGRIRLQRDF
jgi:hypothetical protein